MYADFMYFHVARFLFTYFVWWLEKTEMKRSDLIIEIINAKIIALDSKIQQVE